jgi:hypothetical protein
VCAEIIHHHDITRSEDRCKELLDIDVNRLAGHRSVEDERGNKMQMNELRTRGVNDILYGFPQAINATSPQTHVQCSPAAPSTVIASWKDRRELATALLAAVPGIARGQPSQ